MNDATLTANELVTDNLNLVRFIMKKYFNNTWDEDLYQIGCIGLVKAANKFDATKNVKFSSFATKVIENEYLMLFRKKPIPCISIEEPVTDNLTLSDMLFDEHDSFFELELNEVCTNVLNDFDMRQREIIKLCMADNNQELVGKIYGISQPQVSRIYRKFKKKLNSILMDSGCR